MLFYVAWACCIIQFTDLEFTEAFLSKACDGHRPWGSQDMCVPFSCLCFSCRFSCPAHPYPLTSAVQQSSRASWPACPSLSSHFCCSGEAADLPGLPAPPSLHLDWLHLSWAFKSRGIQDGSLSLPPWMAGASQAPILAFWFGLCSVCLGCL